MRAQRGLSLREAARRAGMVKETISDIERGKTHPYDVTLAKLAQAYEVPIEELLEAPEAGRPDTSETIADTVHDFVIKQDRREAQALNRLAESEQIQASFGHDEHEAMTYLLKRPRGAVEEAYIDLMRSHVNLERENARLKEENARAHVND
jgi:transcriptional regulator with XRE-family HTH domain